MKYFLKDILSLKKETSAYHRELNRKNGQTFLSLYQWLYVLIFWGTCDPILKNRYCHWFKMLLFKIPSSLCFGF